MGESELFNISDEAQKRQEKETLNEYENYFITSVKTSEEGAIVIAREGYTQKFIKNYSSNNSNLCSHMHKFARKLNKDGEYSLKIRYSDSNLILPASLSNPNSCGFYFDWKPTLRDQARYKFDDLIGWFGL